MTPWRYSRKTPGRYNAYGSCRVWREPTPARIVEARLVRETPKAWHVVIKGEGDAVILAKSICTKADDTYTIPGWLWDKLHGADEIR